jgi:hypothetical protein
MAKKTTDDTKTTNDTMISIRIPLGMLVKLDLRARDEGDRSKLIRKLLTSDDHLREDAAA